MRLSVTLAALLFLAGCSHTGKPSGPSAGQPGVARPGGANTADRAALTVFTARLREYQALHDRLEKTLPPLAADASPQARDTHQRGLERLIREHRATARQGELFTPEVERVLRVRLREVFSGPGGAEVRASIMDDNPRMVKLAVNGRYPDDVPVATMPPQVLAVLPQLTEHLEYRFIGPRLILLDVHAHIVADYISNVLPT